MTVRIHGYPVSTWTRTARMACIEKQVDYEFVLTRPGAAPHPFGRIPTFEVDGTTIFETLAIVGYLEEVGPGPSLEPATLAERTRMRMWMSLAADYLFRDVVRMIPRGTPASEEEFSTARTALERVEALIGDTEFLAGDTLTFADLYLAPMIANAEDKAPEVLEGLAAIARWSRGVFARPSFVQTEYR